MADKAKAIADFVSTMYDLPVYDQNVFAIDPMTYTLTFFDMCKLLNNPDNISDYELRYGEMLNNFAASEGIEVLMTGVTDFESAGSDIETFCRHTTIRVYDWNLLL